MIRYPVQETAKVRASAASAGRQEGLLPRLHILRTPRRIEAGMMKLKAYILF